MRTPLFLQPLLLICAASALMAGPLVLWVAQGYANPHAVGFYATALNGFSHAFWWEGELYPRLLAQANGGLGSPVFFFYPPAAFWLSALLEPLAQADPHGMLRLEVSLLLATLASGIACFFWLRARNPGRHALIGALIYVLLPMRLPYLYLDCNLAQCWALVWLPLLFYFIDRLGEGRPRAGAACAAFYALLLMTHVPTFIAFLPVSLAYGALTSADSPKKSWVQLCLLCASLVLALGLASAYLVPLAFLRAIMNTATGPFSPAHYDDASVFLTPDFYVCLPLLLGAYWMYRRSSADQRQQNRPWLVALLLVVFLMTPLSQTLWDRVLLLQYLQLPARRFAAMLFPVLAFLGMRAATTLRWNAVSLAGAALWLAFAAAYPLYAALQAAPPQQSLRPDLAIIEPAFFRTEWIAPQMMGPASLAHWAQAPEVQFARGGGEASVEDWQARSIRLSLRIDSPNAQLTLKRFFFPGWSILSETAHTGIKVYFSRPEGLMALLLLRGSYHLTLLLDRVPGEAGGWFLTLLSLCVLAAWLLLDAWLARRRAACIPA